MAHRAQKSTYVYPVTIKDTNEQLDEEVHKIRSRSVLSAKVAVPVEVGYITLPAHGCVHQVRSSLNLIVSGYL